MSATGSSGGAGPSLNYIVYSVFAGESTDFYSVDCSTGTPWRSYVFCELFFCVCGFQFTVCTEIITKLASRLVPLPTRLASCSLTEQPPTLSSPAATTTTPLLYAIYVTHMHTHMRSHSQLVCQDADLTSCSTVEIGLNQVCESA